MSYEQRELSGSLFINDKRDPEKNQPNMNGKCLIDGTLYYMDAWTKKKDDGAKWLSVAFKACERQADDGAPPPEDDDGDEMPF